MAARRRGKARASGRAGRGVARAAGKKTRRKGGATAKAPKVSKAKLTAAKKAARKAAEKIIKYRRVQLHAAASLLDDFHGGKVNRRTGRIETGCGRPRNDGSSNKL